MLTRNTYLLDIPADCYVDEDDPPLQSNQDIIDCALGTNPFGTPLAATEAFIQAATDYQVSSYPEPWARKLQQKLAAYWHDADITQNNITLGAGSIGVLQQLNTLFLSPGAKMIGFAPQFADYVRVARTRGVVYDGVTLLPPRFTIYVDKLLERLSKDTTAIYIDNPHNPTGQMISLGHLATIACRAQAYNTIVIVDEAYGDFVPKENSAIYLVDKYPNVVVARSFSKGWGLAGLRVGYGVINDKLKDLYDAVDLPFGILDPAAAAASSALDQPEFLTRSQEGVSLVKQQIRNSLRCLLVADTCATTPIMTLTSPDPAVNLQKLFRDQGVLVVDGGEFMDLTSASVRLRVPADADALIERIRSVENSIIISQ